MGSTRAIWAVQDKIALDADEENAIKLKREIVSGRERVVWTADLPTAAKEVEVPDAVVARIKAAIRPWDS